MLSHRENITHTHALCREVSRREAFKRLTFFNGDELHITEVFTQKLLHTDALTLRKFLHREFYTHKRLYTEKFLQTELHRETWPQSSFYTVQNRNFTSLRDIRPSFRAEGLHLTLENHNFHPFPSGFDLWPKFTPFFGLRPSFRAKGLHLELQNRNFTAMFLH